MKECLFCKIASGEIEHSRIYEDDKTVAFLDISPASPKGGHTLIIPKNHSTELSDMSEEDLMAVASTIKKVAKVLKQHFGGGLNILQNNGKEAGQFVMHTHFHLIPRFEGDGIEIEKWTPRQYGKGEMQTLADQIKKLL